MNKLELNSIVCTVRPHIYEFQSITAEEGSVAELVCRSRGSPVPQLHFSKFGESESLLFGENVSRVSLLYQPSQSIKPNFRQHLGLLT